MIKKSNVLFFICLLFLFSGCARSSDVEQAEPGSLLAVYDDFFTNMQERYVFWDIDSTNWAEKASYREQFVALDINSAADRLLASDLFREMCADLIDHHYSISFQAEGLSGVSINPARDRKLSQGILQSTNSYPEVLAALESPYYDVTFDDNTRFVTGKLNAQTLLFKTNQFRFARNQSAGTNTTMQAAFAWFLQEANNPAVSNVVLDLRSCAGGDLVDLGLIMGGLIGEDLNFGFTKYKQGRDPLSYSPLIPAILTSSRVDQTTAPQIIVLTDTQTASLAELMAYIVQRHSLGEVIGQKTYGAFSPISDPDIFFSGELNISDFMTVRTSSVQFLAADGASLEGKGIVPSVPTSDALGALAPYIQ